MNFTGVPPSSGPPSSIKGIRKLMTARPAAARECVDLVIEHADRTLLKQGISRYDNFCTVGEWWRIFGRGMSAASGPPGRPLGVVSGQLSQ